jgi:1-acyl-sn-glycerol-3-phosphate acyltransferase
MLLQLWSRFMLWALGWEFVAKDKDRLWNTEKVVLVTPHTSFWDAIIGGLVAYGHMPWGRPRMLTIEEYTKMPLVGAFLYWYKHQGFQRNHTKDSRRVKSV